MNILYPKNYLQRCGAVIEPATCFVIIPFDNSFMEIFSTIQNALLQLSPPVTAIRADKSKVGNAIIADVLAGIASADFIIAVITGRNPNVFYELGICHVAKDDVILVSQKSKRLPFDVEHLRCLEYEVSPSGLSVFSCELQKSVQALMEARRQAGEVERMKQLGSIGALRVSDWFSARLDALKAIAGWPELQENDVAGHEKVMSKIASVLQKFAGGVYTLDETGKVLSSFPRYIQGQDIRGQNYANREYFTLCSSQRKGIISNSFDSANRKHTIVVAAVPRFDVKGVYLGILDAVLDIDAAPLDAIVQPAAFYAEARAQLLLIDQRRVVIASNTPGLTGKSVGGNAIIGTLFSAQGSPSSTEVACLDGPHAAAAFPVSQTPFQLVAVSGPMILP